MSHMTWQRMVRDQTDAGDRRPGGMCEMSGCKLPVDRRVPWKQLTFDLCDKHAGAIDAAQEFVRQHPAQETP